MVSGLAEPADRGVGHRPSDVGEQLELTVAHAVGQPLEDFLLADGSHPARHALAARFVTEERGDAADLVDEVDVLVEDHHLEHRPASLESRLVGPVDRREEPLLRLPLLDAAEAVIVGDTVVLGASSAWGNCCGFTGWVKAANVVTVRWFNCYGGSNCYVSDTPLTIMVSH